MRCRPAAILLAGLCVSAIAGCGDTLQDRPIPHNVLESLIEAPIPVYWLGASFNGMAVTEATHDPGGAYNVQYGNCVRGGQGVCIPPLRVVTSPDNSFLPGGSTRVRITSIRGVAAKLAQAGHAIVLASGGVVIDVYANSSQLALAAAATAAPINQAGAPEAELPTPLPDTGFAETPLSSQVPTPLRPLP